MQKKDCVQIKFCRLCNSKNLKKVIDLGKTPLANAYSKVKISKKLKRYPLGLKYCFNCGHLQLTHSVKPSKMFSNYLYKTNTSKKNFLHFKKYADEIKKKYKSNGGKILDIASNDGTFLNFFEKIENGILEIRTKSPNIQVFKKRKPLDNVIVAYSLNPNEIIKGTYKGATITNMAVSSKNIPIKI